MKMIIDNVEFDYNVACKLLKLKYKDCPFDSLTDIWNDIETLSFTDIAKLTNVEQRRIGILHLGMERLISQVEPKLINKETINKTTTWVDSNGELVTKEFKDTYELYQVSGDKLSKGLNGWNKIPNSYYIKFKDTSTDREYLLWINPNNVFRTNNENGWYKDIKDINAIQCIAWTIQTNIPKGSIKEILRQGDCILIKPKNKEKLEFLDTPRHLTENEYRKLLVAES